jgi:hypothetical protein
MAIEHEEIDLSLVVDSIKHASDRELKVLSEISAKLDQPVGVGVVSSGENQVMEGGKKAPSIPNNKPKRRKKNNAKARRGEVTAQLVKRKQQDSFTQAEEGEAGTVEPQLTNPSSVADSLQPAQQEGPKSDPKAPTVVVTPPASQNDRKDASESQPVSVNVDSPDVDTDSLKKAITDGFSAFDDFWKDEKGRLRRGNGTYASKEESARYQKTAADIAKERESEKQSTILTKVVGTFRAAVDVGHEAANNDATDAAGAAAGGSWFYAAKELYNVGENVIQGIDTAVDKTSEIKKQWTSSDAFSFGRFFGKDKETQEAFTSAEVVPQGSERAEISKQESTRSQSDTVTQSDRASSAFETVGQSDRVVAQSESEKKSDTATSIKELAESKTQQSNRVQSDSKLTDRSDSQSIAQSTGFTQSFGNAMAGMATGATQAKSEPNQPAGGESLLSITKQQSLQANNKEILQEQSEEQKQSNAEIIALLDEISSHTKGKDNGLLSELAGLGSLFGGGGGRAGRGRRGRGRGGLFGGGERGRGRPSRSVSVGKPESPSRLKSVLSATGKKGAGIAAGGMSMAGKAFKGVSTLARGAGKAVPFLAPMLAAYDAYSGFNDKEAQQKTFNLKEGEEATTGQKAAMAAGSVLDMGGLVSGAAGLVGDALGALGFEGAKEKMTFEASDIAKGIYDLFTSKSSSESKQEDSKAATVSQSQSSSSYQDEVDRLVGRGMPLSVAKKVAKQKEKNLEMKARSESLKQTEQSSVASSSAESSEVQQGESQPSNARSKRVEDRLEKIKETKERYQNAQQQQVDGMPVAKVAAVGGVTKLDKSGGVTELNSAGGITNLSPEGGVIDLGSAGGVTDLGYTGGVTDLSSAGGVTDLSSAGGVTDLSSTGGVTSLSSTGGVTDLSSTGGITSLSSSGGVTDLSSTGGITKLQPTSSVSKVQTNRSVSSLQAEKAQAELQKSKEPNVIQLDKKSVDDLAKGIKKANADTTVVEVGASQSTGSAAKPKSNNPGVGSIPNNFTDRSLQRQSADLE